MTPRKVEFDLLSNAVDWLHHAIHHLASLEDEPTSADYKHAMLAVNTESVQPRKRPRQIRVARQILQRVDVKIYPIVKLLRVASMAPSISSPRVPFTRAAAAIGDELAVCFIPIAVHPRL
jgi:hypothetical protein